MGKAKLQVDECSFVSNGLDIGCCILYHKCSVVALGGVSCCTFDTHTCRDTTYYQVSDGKAVKMVC